MRCIFCKNFCSKDKSVEHIVPESLGNVSHILPAGAVCDRCNNYFSRKIEQPLMASPMFRLLRAAVGVPNKRGIIPSWQPGDGTSQPDYRLMGRFLAKVGLEVLALRTLSVPNWNEQLVAQAELDELRRFARYNEGPDWPFSARAIHPANGVFEGDNGFFEVLHEFDLLMTESSEIYLVISLFGTEMVINLGGREMEGYGYWLVTNHRVSPLYSGKNVEQIA